MSLIPKLLSNWWKESPLAGYGILGHSADRLFWLLEWISPITWFLGNRPQAWERTEGKSREQLEEHTKKRAREVERFLASYLIVDIILAASVMIYFPDLPLVLRLILLIFAVWRILDVLQATVNVSLFHHLRKPLLQPQLASYCRTVVLTIINYAELLVLFALLYSVAPFFEVRNGILDATDFFYFSIISQTSIGYGDITPRCAAKTIGVIQGVVGLYFTLLILARVIAMLPKPKAFVEGEEFRGE